MTTLTARQIILKEFGNSRNLITPTVLEVGNISDNTAYEISKGTGIIHDWVYGVTIVDYDPETNTTTRRDHEQENGSCMFYSLGDAQEYIRQLKAQEVKS
jgi:hypothetical protein